ncbi:hypothetical protein CRYUN_Cryun11dG0112500 [Craigia yunnanensis]
MDSHKFLGGKGGRYSKAQMCLQKILSIICSIPPHHQQNPEPKSSFHHHLLHELDSSSSSSSLEKAQPFGHQGFHIDLNLELISSPETENSSVGIDSTEAKSNQEKSAKEESFFEQRGNPVSETDVEDEKIKETMPFHNREFGQGEGYLPLFTEAEELSLENVELQRGELGTELGTQEVNGKESVQEGRECWVVDLHGRFDEVSQVIRTKRGRRLVLPCRYKDSVLQPLAKNAGSRKRRRLKVMKSM